MTHALVHDDVRQQVERNIVPYEHSSLRRLFDDHGVPPHAVKYVQSRWASTYQTPDRLKISTTPGQTWGTGTYVSPVVFPLSSVLYGRIGLVTDFDPTGWRVFDATRTAARNAYLRWAQTQSAFQDLVLTVHSGTSNHMLRNTFRRDFWIDCVLFRPDQEAEVDTDRANHLWMLVTDWAPGAEIAQDFSDRLARARFTVLIDEEFDIVTGEGLPIQVAHRKIETVTRRLNGNLGMPVTQARLDGTLGAEVVNMYRSGGFLHVYVEP